MHACGHDCHAAVLYGVLQHLAADPDFEGTLFGLFQPAEEKNPGGASLVLAETPSRAMTCGRHRRARRCRTSGGEARLPRREVHGPSDELRFTLHGAGGHAAMRQQLKDPVVAAAELMTRLRPSTARMRVSIGRVEADGATNVIPDESTWRGRCAPSTNASARHPADDRNIAAEIDARHGVETGVDINRGYPCVVNDEVSRGWP